MIDDRKKKGYDEEEEGRKWDNKEGGAAVEWIGNRAGELEQEKEEKGMRDASIHTEGKGELICKNMIIKEKHHHIVIQWQQPASTLNFKICILLS